MMRSLFIAIFMMGLFASMMTRCASGRPPPGDAAAEAFRAAAGDGSAPSEQSSSRITEDGVVQLQRSPDGHFYADVQINGATVHALVDTGASGIALSRDAASSAGIATSIGMPEVVGQGADGDVHGEVVTLDRIALGSKSAEGMRAVVLNTGSETLLGQSFLSKFDSVEIHGDTMELK